MAMTIQNMTAQNMTAQNMTSQTMTLRCTVKRIIEVSRKQWAAEAADQASMNKIPARPKRGGGKQARVDENEYALQAGSTWVSHVTDLTVDRANGL